MGSGQSAPLPSLWDEHDTTVQRGDDGETIIARRPPASLAPSLHVLITSIGRPEPDGLRRQIRSLLPQLTSRDAMTIVYDARDDGNTLEAVSQDIRGFPCAPNVTITREAANLGFHGHAIRNKYATLLQPRCDYVLHGDDDDTYMPDALHIVRDRIREYDRSHRDEPPAVHVFRMRIGFLAFPLIPIAFASNLSTPSCAVPWDVNAVAQWGLRVGGDHDFGGNAISAAGAHAMWPDVIYAVRDG